ncbi:tRNA (adenosine(37)-N6)-dimethylallyltransferase MiaA [Mesorhizobium sp. CAU 1741]|uniref:tRNA (adenosine(37)-N6)-dimethylallyltransferase MiaA n=1 Tax=Mesorhizobium sp. CAU 1741 TaxID=3140366 RepID=UPI00325B6FA1
MINPARQGPNEPLKNAILIAGPTASGKSALALKLAQETGGVIVNADSMQVYGVLRVLTARPDDADLATAPHHLYGHVDPREYYSTGRWMREVADLIASGKLENRPAIFVGGTGLYFRALTEGLSAMPSIPDDVRARWRDALAAEGPEAMHALLAERDAATAARLKPGDGQRIVRALEVHEASGRSITHWQQEAGRPLVDEAKAQLFVIEPERALLHARIEARFDAMMEHGAMQEVLAFGALGVDDAMPAMKAIGVRELQAADRGEISLAEAVARAKAATRQYAKRQSTWFRNQLGPAWRRIDSTDLP